MSVLETPPAAPAATDVVAEMASAVPVARNPVLGGPVVLGLHGGESSPAAIHAARLLAERHGLGLRVLTVVEPEALFGPGLDVWPITPMPIGYGLAEDQAAGVRHRLQEAIGDEGWKVDVRYGRPASEIARFAKDLRATAIVMDAAPHRGLRREVAGIRVLQALRHAPCPVLSVASDMTAFPKRVLAAIDFSPASIRAAHAALLLMPEQGTLRLLHVMLPLRLPRPVEDRSGAVIGGDVSDELRRVADELGRYASPGVTIERQVSGGLVGAEILEAAEAMSADLIAVGAQGRDIVERLFVGSIASQVVHLAPVSVLASPTPPAAEFLRLKLRITDTIRSENRTEWRELLDTVSRRNTGRRVTIEVDDPAIGAQMQSIGYVFRGAAYDPGDHRVDLMVGSPAGDAHLTRTIPNVRSVAITATKAGRDLAIDVTHGDGQTLVLFEE